MITRPNRWYDYLTINIFWLALTTLSQTMTPLVIPLLIQRFLGDELKGTYYGILRLWTLMIALLFQAMMGMLSDHSTSRYGKRRPFILAGALGIIFTLLLIGFTSDLEGLPGYSMLFGLVILQMIFANTAHGAQQGLIPDLVPLEKRGRFSGAKAFFEVPLPVILVSITIARMISKGDLPAGLSTLIIILLICTSITLFVKEEPQQSQPEPLNWKPFIQLSLMTLAFLVVILIMGAVVDLIRRIDLGLTGLPLVFVFGLLGMTCILFAILIGVWISIKIGVGKEIQNHPSFTWWVINRLAFLVGSTNLASFVVYYLQARMGYYREEAATPASILMMVVGVFILMTAIPAGWLADRVDKKQILFFSGLLGAAGAALAVTTPALPVIYAGGVLIGIATGLFYTANWALGTEIVPPQQAGRFLGISNLAGAGAGAIGAYIGGPIADLLTTRVPEFPGIGYILLFSIYGMMFLLSVIALNMITVKRSMVGSR